MAVEQQWKNREVDISQPSSPHLTMKKVWFCNICNMPNAFLNFLMRVWSGLHRPFPRHVVLPLLKLTMRQLESVNQLDNYKCDTQTHSHFYMIYMIFIALKLMEFLKWTTDKS